MPCGARLGCKRASERVDECMHSGLSQRLDFHSSPAVEVRYFKQDVKPCKKRMLEQPKVAFARASKVRHCDAKSERGGFRVVQTWGCIGEQQAEGAERGP